MIKYFIKLLCYLRFWKFLMSFFNEQPEISYEVDGNQNNENFSEKVLVVMRLMMNLDLWTLNKDQYLI